MNNSREVTLKWFGNIKFDEESHTYSDDEGTIYSSVTEYIGEFFPKFDQEGISQRIASRDGVSQVEVLKQWEDKARFGTDIHNRIEELLSNPFTLPSEEELTEEHFSVRQALSVVRGIKVLHNVKAIYPEVRIFNKDYKLAGTIDLLMITHDNEIVLADWKTSNSIYTANKSHSTHELTKHLNDNNYTKYSLQLNTYSYLLPQEYKVIASYLVHLKPFYHHIPYTLYLVGNHYDDIKNLLELRK